MSDSGDWGEEVERWLEARAAADRAKVRVGWALVAILVAGIFAVGAAAGTAVALAPGGCP